MTAYPMKLASTLAALALFAMPAAAGAGNEIPDGNKLLHDCRIHESSKSTDGPLNALSTGYCQGFVKGVLQAAAFVDPPLVCQPPEGVALGQAVKVVLQHLEDHPELRYMSELEVTLDALRQAYPCKKHARPAH
jgi:hypothetical protein